MNKTEFRQKILYPIYVNVKTLLGSPLHLPYQKTENDANDAIKASLDGSSPCMICRLGATELRTIIGYLNATELTTIKRIWHKIHLEPCGFPKKIKWMMSNYSGFFPSTEEKLSKFCTLMLDDMKEADILGCWRPEELRVRKFFPNHLQTIPLGNLEPFFFQSPWTIALKGKKILVIHPFKDSILKQYERRKELFSNPNILPDFDLKVIPAVQSLGGKSIFNSWFDALDFMKDEIDKQDFDIALIGAGAYGFPLAAHIKRQGKKAFHIGGVLQMLFGIYGNRWLMSSKYKILMNQSWIRPQQSETPMNSQKVENATYW